MTDTSKRPEWLPTNAYYSYHATDGLFGCDFCMSGGPIWIIPTDDNHHPIRLCINSPDCESAARKAIGGGE